MKPYYQDVKAGITIFHADCLDVLPGISKKDVGLILMDPPYGINHSSNREASWQNRTIHGDNDTSLRDFVIRWGDGLPMFVFGSWKATKPARTRGVLIWDKGPAFGMGDLAFPWKMSHEEIYVLGDGFTGRRDESILRGHFCPPSESQGRLHQHQKPISLFKYLLNKVTRCMVLDPFMGTGTTLRAAKDIGHRAIGIEIEERYCEIAASRLAQEVFQFM